MPSTRSAPSPDRWRPASCSFRGSACSSRCSVVSGCLIAAALIVRRWRTALPDRPRARDWLAAAAAAGCSWPARRGTASCWPAAPTCTRRSCRRISISTTQLKAGTLLYYREGASATVSVKRLTGTTTLAVDGKVDASNRGDMLTQKLIAHLPLLRPRPPARGRHHRAGQRRHRRRGADAIRSRASTSSRSRRKSSKPRVLHRRESRRARRTRARNLIVGDGRSHLLLSRDRSTTSSSRSRRTRGLPASRRSSRASSSRRRAPASRRAASSASGPTPTTSATPDLRSIVATFQVGVPARHGLAGRRRRRAADGVGWLRSTSGSPDRATHWTRPGVAEDLALGVRARCLLDLVALRRRARRAAAATRPGADC